MNTWSKYESFAQQTSRTWDLGPSQKLYYIRTEALPFSPSGFYGKEHITRGENRVIFKVLLIGLSAFLEDHIPHSSL